MCVTPRRVALVVSLSLALPALARGDDPPPDLGPVRESLPAALRQAAKAAEAIPDAATRDDALRAIGRAFLRIGERDAAREALRRSLGGRDDASLTGLARIACDLAKAGDRATALDLFHRAEQTIEADTDPRSQAYYLLEIARNEVQADETELARHSARRAFEIARSLRDQAARKSYLYDLLAVQRTIGDGEGLQETLHRVLRDLENPFGRREGEPPVNEDLFETNRHGAMIDALLTAGEADEAIGRIERWLKESPSEAYLLGQVADAILSPPSRSPFVDLSEEESTRLDAAEGRRALERLRPLAEEQDDDIKAEVLARIAAAEGRLGDFDAAVATIRRIGRLRGCEPRQVTPLIAVARKMGAAGEAGAARDLLREAFAVWKEVPVDDADVLGLDDLSSEIGTGFEAIARAQAEVGDLDGARRTFRTLAREHETRDGESDLGQELAAVKCAEVLAALAAAQARAGERAAAIETAEEALKILDTIPDGPRSRDLRLLPLESIAAAQAEAGDVEAAIRTADAIKDGLGPDGIALMRASTLQDVAQILAKNGDLPGALRALDAGGAMQMPLRGGEDDDARGYGERPLRDVARAYAEANDPVAALRWAEGLPTVAGRCWALLGIAEGLTLEGKAKR